MSMDDNVASPQEQSATPSTLADLEKLWRWRGVDWPSPDSVKCADELAAALRPSEGPETGRPPEELQRLQQDNESLRAQFAAFADKIQALEIRVSNSREWGHMRPAVLAGLSVIAGTARKMANGQPAYVPTYKIRAEKAEAELNALRAALPAGPETGDRERLLELATEGAIARHTDARQQGLSEHSSTRFGTCPHPDCVLVRQAAPAASEG